MQTTLPSYIVNVLPGGKYHEMAIELAKDSTKTLENKVPGGPWEDVSNYACPFNNNGEYRIKPKVTSYRVCLLRDGGESYCYTISTKKQEASLEKYPQFMHWITDWIEVEVK